MINKTELRSFDISSDGTYIFAGGHSGVFVWDLRKTDEPVANLAKQMDCYSLKRIGDTMFMGNLNHSILAF